MPTRAILTPAAGLALLALLLPRDEGMRAVEAALHPVATDDACFYDVGSGTCMASAMWVTGEHGLLRTPRANLLADVAAGIQTCASAFGDAQKCATLVGTCEYDATFIPNTQGGFDSVGGCFPSLSWAAKIAERCVAEVASEDTIVAALLATATQCVAHTAEGDAQTRCENDEPCAWTFGDADSVPGYCAPDPVIAAVTALGASNVRTLMAAKTTCEAMRLETPCISDLNCEWRGVASAADHNATASAAGSCAPDVAHVLRDAVASPALEAYLARIGHCAGSRALRGGGVSSRADELAADCVSKKNAGCAWGLKRTSTNIIPETFGGDRGDGSGGWVRPADTPNAVTDNATGSCFPTYASLLDTVPGLNARGGGTCGSLAPLFEAAEACAVAGGDRAACDSRESCVFATAGFGGNPELPGTFMAGRCALDASAAIVSLMSDGDAAVVRAVSDVCARGGEWNATECVSAGSSAASAGRRAGASSDAGGTDADAGNARAVSSEASYGAYFVLFCFAFFVVFVAPPVAYANHLKNKGEDVCDVLPAALHPYVPSRLRPRASRYESFVGQERGDDL